MISNSQHTRKTAKMSTHASLIIVLTLFLVQSNGKSVTDGVLYEDYTDEDSNESSVQTNKPDDEFSVSLENMLNSNRDELRAEADNDVELLRLNNYDRIATLEQFNDIEKVYNSDKYRLEEYRSFNKEEETDDNRLKRTIDSDLINETDLEEDCVGTKLYCNMSKEEYVTMLNEYIYPQTYEWVLIGTHAAVFVIGLVGNALVCIAVYRNHSMRTVTNYFIVNLAVADFMVILFCLPPTVLWDVTETWFLGNVLCKLLLYFQSVSVTVSVLTLTFISVDRWYAICFPLKFKSTTGRAKTAILIIWTIALIFNSPDLVVLETVKSVPLRFNLEYLVQCMATWSAGNELVWHVLKVLFIYTIPLLLMTVAYYQIVKVLWKNKKIPGQAETMKLAPAEQTQLRSRRKAAKMLVAVVIMFAVCYFPIHLLCLLRYTVDMEQTDAVTFLALVSHVLCYANSAINPLIYNFMSGKFRREFRRTFCCFPGALQDNFTTLTRVTTSKIRQPSMALNYQGQRVSSPYVCSTTFVENGHRKGYLT